MTTKRVRSQNKQYTNYALLSKPIVWEEKGPEHTLEELINGIAPSDSEQGFILTRTDESVLEALYAHSFLMQRHIMISGNRPRVVSRMQRLFRHGLVAKARPGAAFGKKAVVYSLTAFGAETLVARGIGIPDDWKPPYIRQGYRDNVVHQIEVADLCSALAVDLAQLGEEDIELVGSRALTHRIHPMYAKGQGLVVIPDSAFWIGSRLTCLIEHERTWRVDKFLSKMENYRRLLAGDTWEVYGIHKPLVIVSINDEGSSTRFKTACDIAINKVERVVLLPQSGWAAGDTTATTMWLTKVQKMPMVEAVGHYLG